MTIVSVSLPRMAPSWQTPVRHGVTLPHALLAAHSSLDAALGEAIDLYNRTVRFPNPWSVIEAIERFVHELRLVPEWFAELEQRAALVKSACAEGSAYDEARRGALGSSTATSQALCRGSLAINRLRSARTGFPVFVAEVIETKRDIDGVLEEPSLELTPAARGAFGNWQHECRKAQREAERLEVDGCWYLYHVYLAAEPQCSEESKTARAIMQTHMGGVNLESIRAAAHSITARVCEVAHPASPGGVQPGPCASTERKEKSSRKGPGKEEIPKRSWTQNKLDEAIREHQAKRASTYDDLVDGVKRGKPGAQKSARQLFGRNAIARALGVKSPAMVSRSIVWQGIADDLGLRGPTKKAKRARGQRIGMEIALEEGAVASGNSTMDQVIRRETIHLIERGMPPKEAGATLEKLERGEMTDDQAEGVVKAYAEQQHDDGARRIRQNL